MIEQPNTDESGRRKAFMSNWRSEAYAILGVKAHETPLEECDLRDCPNERYADVSRAIEAKTARLAEAFRVDRPQFSADALRFIEARFAAEAAE